MKTFDKFINAIKSKDLNIALGVIYELSKTDYPRLAYVRDKAKDYIKGECFVLSDYSENGEHKQEEIKVRSCAQFETWFLDSEFIKHCSLVDERGFKLNDIEIYTGDYIQFEFCERLETGVIASVNAKFCMVDIGNGKRVPAHKNHIKRVIKETLNTETA